MTERTLRTEEELIRRLDGERDGVPPVAPAPPGETETRGEWARQDAALRLLYSPVMQEAVPGRLVALLEKAAEAEGAVESDATKPAGAAAGGAAKAGAVRGVWGGRIAAALALVAVGAALGFGAARLTAPTPGELQFAKAALLAHDTFAPEVFHPVEVGADRLGHLSTWMTKRVGLPVTPPDFAAEGFTLVGGRVLPDEHGAAAAMMYEDAEGRRVTVYVAPEPSVHETSLRLAERRGTEGWWWVDHGYGCAVVGEAPREVLKILAEKAYETLSG